MLTAVVLVYLLGLSPLVLVGLWRIDREAARAATQRQLQARRIVRATRRLVQLSRAVHRLTNLVRAERLSAEQNRAKVTDFIDGPPSMRRPELPEARPATSRPPPRDGTRSE
jgi:hypothetical protein